MPGFSRPDDEYRYRMKTEARAIDNGFVERGVPKRRRNRLLVASWNLANLGDQDRTPLDLRLMAHLLSRFDLIAVQEIKRDHDHFERLVGYMDNYDFVMSDTAGNEERLAFIYRSDRVTPRQMFGEIALPKRVWPRYTVKVPYRSRGKDKVQTFRNHPFQPFDRNPFIGTFRCDRLDFTIVNVHLYYGASKSRDRKKYARRVLEIFALAKWAEKHAKRDDAYDNDIVLTGDMNVPTMDQSEPAYKALLRSGLQPTQYASKTGSNLDGTKAYDQLAVTPGHLGRIQTSSGVFDFDNFVYRRLWNRLVDQNTKHRATKLFRSYLRAYLSDHRPLWIEFRTR